MKLIEKFKEFQKSDNKENFVLQNITFISILILILIWGLFLIQQIFCFINSFIDLSLQLNYLDLKFLITTSGAIFVFWYGYKKYERDKGITFLTNSINNTNKYNINELINEYYVLDLLLEKSYIDEDYYNEIINTIISKLYFYLYYNLDKRKDFRQSIFQIENKGNKIKSIEKILEKLLSRLKAEEIILENHRSFIEITKANKEDNKKNINECENFKEFLSNEKLYLNAIKNNYKHNFIK